MRALLRAFLLVGLAFTIISISLLGYHHDDWKNHVDTVKDRLKQVKPPKLDKYIPQAFKKKPDASPVEYGSLPWLGKVEVDPLPYPSESEKAIVMARLSSEDTAWVNEKLPEYVK